MKNCHYFNGLWLALAATHPAKRATTGNSCRAAAMFFADPGARRPRPARAAIAAELGVGAFNRDRLAYSPQLHQAAAPEWGLRSRLLLCCFRRLD
jgi:hypothetical protein